VVTVSASAGSSAIGSIVRTVALLDDARGASTQRLRDVRAALARLVALPFSIPVALTTRLGGDIRLSLRRRHRPEQA
jgi:hypothetical protein